jgi:hypothetical protein
MTMLVIVIRNGEIVLAEDNAQLLYVRVDLVDVSDEEVNAIVGG